ncbi:MAG TPA: hypothetical protein PKV92_09245, partial [Thermodesulfovibrio thiophilus]|nr:hypothetical protein [Thermodesulfovibrio thiophilus]
CPISWNYSNLVSFHLITSCNKFSLKYLSMRYEFYKIKRDKDSIVYRPVSLQRSMSLCPSTSNKLVGLPKPLLQGRML